MYRSILPEYYQLATITENNSWHNNQNVLDHVIAVFAGLEKTLQFAFINTITRKGIESYLTEKFGTYSKRELLKIATILQDIAKTKTLITASSGQTRCPGHEIIGSVMIKNFVDRFDLDLEGKERIKKIILLHGFTHDLLGLIVAKGDPLLYFDLLKQAAPDFWIELLLLAYADMLGSDIQQALPDDFKKREKLIITFLEQVR